MADNPGPATETRTSNAVAINAFREARHLSTAELARRARVTPQYVGRILRGDRQGSLSTIQSLADALQVPIEAITYPETAAR